jgi:fluoride ion exporter CrcB/FEX
LKTGGLLFILIPALGNFTSAYERFQTAGTFDHHVRNELFWGVFFVLLSASFLISVDFGLIWPAFLILGGLGMLLGALQKKTATEWSPFLISSILNL